MNLTIHLYLFTLEVKKIDKVFKIVIPEGSKVVDLLYELSARFQDIKIIDGKKTSYVLSIVNGIAVPLSEDLKDGDNVSILPLVDGG